MSSSPRNGSKLVKTMSFDDEHVNAPRGSSIVEIALGPNMVSNSPQNGPESVKITSVDDLHVNAPRGLPIVEITSGPQNSE